MKTIYQHILCVFILTFFLSSSFVQAQNGIIKGRVFDPINNESIPFANVVIQGTTNGTTTDLDGNYEINQLAPGLYNLEVSYVGYKKNIVFEIQVSNARPAIEDITLEPDEEVLDAVVVKADPFSKSKESPVSLRSIGVNEVKRNPGGNRDISRAVQSLPGVASTPTFRNDILIRGGAPGENRFYLDGIEIPVINHFATQGSSGGPVGMINVDFIRQVDFYSSAFPAARGNALSSVFDFQFKEGNKDRLFFSGVLGSSDAGVTLEGPLGEKTTFIFSARRSYLQFLFQIFELPFLPTYNDAQFKIKHNINDKNTLTILGIGAYDDFALNLEANETEEQQAILDVLPDNDQRNYTLGMKYTNFRDNSYTNVVLSRSHLENVAVKYRGNDESSQDNLLLDYSSEEIENKLRVENISRINGYKIIGGINYERAQYLNSTFNRISVGTQVIDVNYDADLGINKWGLFGQASRDFMDSRLTLSAGFRADANDYSDDMNNLLEQFSPRVAASFKLSEQFSFNANVGRYYQLPPYTVLGFKQNDQFINQNNGVTYIRADHLVGGVEWNSANNNKVSVEGFLKDYSNYPFSINDSISLANVGADFGTIGDEGVTSTSTGRAYGVEFLFQQKLFKGFYGIAAYTLSWSEFSGKDGTTLISSSWDNRHLISLTAGKKFGKNWELGARFLFNSGAPYTPYDAATSALIPVWDVNGGGILDRNALNTERLDPYYTLDMRLDKKWFFDKWNLNVFFDVQNLTGNAVEFQPDLLLVRDEMGQGVVNPEDPSRYLLKELSNNSALVQPSIGIITEF